MRKHAGAAFVYREFFVVMSSGAGARFKAFVVRKLLRRPYLFKDRYGMRYRLEPTDDLALYFRHRGWFEEGEQEFCQRYLQPGMTAVDVGAYIGIYTCLMAKLVGPSGLVCAFEPSGRSFERLQGNVARNGLDNVMANRVAVGSGRGQCRLFSYVPPLESLSSLVHAEVTRRGRVVKPETTELVEIVSLDEYCGERDIRRIDLLKLDAEGAELNVLLGAQRLLADERIVTVLFEVGAESESVIQHLSMSGFQLFTVDVNGSLEPVAKSGMAGHMNGVAVHDSLAGRKEFREGNAQSRKG